MSLISQLGQVVQQSLALTADQVENSRNLEFAAKSIAPYVRATAEAQAQVPTLTVTKASSMAAIEAKQAETMVKLEEQLSESDIEAGKQNLANVITAVSSIDAATVEAINGFFTAADNKVTDIREQVGTIADFNGGFNDQVGGQEA